MEIGYSIQLVLPISSREAVESGYEHIEPEHLFNALLKFAEIDSGNLKVLLKDKTILPGLLEEQDAVRRIFLEYGHSVPQGTTALRRSLRKLMGKGGFKHDPQSIIHRSEASRRLCKQAEELAGEARALSWQGAHLTAALLEYPQGSLAEALKAVKPELPKPVETPLLDRYGRNPASAAEGTACQRPADPAVKVVLESIQNAGENNLLLIEAGGRTALEVIRDVAALPWTDEQKPRFVGINLTSIRNDAKRKPDLLECLLEEAIRIKAVLFLEGLPELLENDKTNTVTLERSLSDKQLRCVCVADEAVYRKWFEKKQPWRRLLRPVWLHPLPKMPW